MDHDDVYRHVDTGSVPLMRRSLLLALGFAAVGCGSAGVRVGEAPRLVAVAPQPVPVPVTVVPQPPPGAVVVWYADARCTPSVPSVTLPDPARAACLMREARLAMVRIVRRDAVAPGVKSPCWAYVDPQEYAACLDWQARKLPAVSYGHSPRHVRGSLYGTPWEGCAAGISGDPIFVSLAEPGRVLALHAWEATNEFLWRSYGRLDLTDGPLVAEATTAATAACGV